DRFAERLEEYLEKALREAKRHSNWTAPNEAYETATKSFANRLLDKNRSFWKSFTELHQKVAERGIINSLSQLLLKITSPGVPDIYQGCESWDLSLVDPDNRRPVDYKNRIKDLESFENKNEQALLSELWQNKTDGRIKLWLTKKLLQIRQSSVRLYGEGDYIPLKVEGEKKNQVLAFARRLGQELTIVIAPLNAPVMEQDFDWAETRVLLPASVNQNWKSLLEEKSGKAVTSIFVKDAFAVLPFAILQMQAKTSERSAGILLHISSLSSPFGIGDLGPQAYAFIDFLRKSGQKYWQLLPINPTEAGQGHSPYSAISSQAGNPLFISPEALVEEQFLQPGDLSEAYLSVEALTDYDAAEEKKHRLFEIAWQAFQQGSADEKQAFEAFCEAEKDWLDDFALYKTLKAQFVGKPWYEWAEELRLRKTDALINSASSNKAVIEKEKWLQFVFYKQWKRLKVACNAEGIKLIGDLPFYVSYDSADVWANQHLFKLDEQGQRLGIAGVPPDAFSADGQLWGMPVFRWEVMKEGGYGWWIERLRKNAQLFDLVRLDHFRAFADYWEVPANASTAKEGEWKEGPGVEFFNAVKAAFGELPFIAEDLGEINDAVLELRDAFELPGMKILQFAFGEDLPSSAYIPHNYQPNFIVYTGTHDNNTTKGWYRQETNQAMRLRINQYLGNEVNEDSVALQLSRLAYASVANTVITPMQDLLNLDEVARMNTPSSGENNWRWRLLPSQVSEELSKQLKQWTKLYNRI
ncbi:MAG: malQ, partial [Flaviaesturariibacter sp.]|nr:malQ [Flaviaesturariibacter sp.]